MVYVKKSQKFCGNFDDDIDPRHAFEKKAIIAFRSTTKGDCAAIKVVYRLSRGKTVFVKYGEIDPCLAHQMLAQKLMDAVQSQERVKEGAIDSIDYLSIPSHIGSPTKRPWLILVFDRGRIFLMVEKELKELLARNKRGEIVLDI